MTIQGPDAALPPQTSRSPRPGPRAGARPPAGRWRAATRLWSDAPPARLREAAPPAAPGEQRWLAYTVAVLGAAAGLAFHALLLDGQQTPLLPVFLGAAALAAFYGGLPAGILSLGLSTVGSAALLARGMEGAAQADIELLRLAMLLAVGIPLCLLVARLRSGRETLLASEGPLQLLLGRIPAGAWSTGADLLVAAARGEPAQALGLVPGRAPGVALPGNLAMQPGPQAAELLRAHQRALQGKTWHGEVEWGGRFFQTAVEPLLDRQGHIAGTVGAALDVTGVDRGEQLHYVQHEVTRVLAGSLSFPEAIPRVLPLIGEAFAWATGAFWSVDRETRRMRCVAVWSRNPDTSQPFLFETEGLHYHMSACIPGKVWYTRQPLWIADVALDLSFRRADVAAAAGLRGGLWLPVLAGGDVLGVLELMNTHGQAPEPEARLLLEDVCRQLGEFGRRWRAEEVTKQLATVLEASPDCVGLCDLNGRPLYVNRAGRTLLGLGADGDLARFRLADFFPPAMARRVLEEGVPAALAQGAWQGETALLNLRTGEATPVSQVLICHKRADGSPEFFSTVARRVRRRDAASG